MKAPAQPFAELPMLGAAPWQMSYGERAALEGVLAQLRPELAVEIGTAEGGSLTRIAAWSTEVHSFDLVEPAADVAALANVVRHTGDSHALLPQVLAELAEAGRNVDFVLVDGDHSAEGARKDVEDLLASEAIGQTLILLHDTLNDVVRRGLEAVDYTAHDKVAWVELDLVPGYLARREPYRLDLWGGLGLIVVDASAPRSGARRDDRFHELVSLIRPARDVMREIEARGTPLDAASPAAVEQTLRRELELSRRRVADIEGSMSWRLTEPLRRLRHRGDSR